MGVFPHPTPLSARHLLGTDSLGRDVPQIETLQDCWEKTGFLQEGPSTYPRSAACEIIRPYEPLRKFVSII
jgi:hypothetical protein